MGAQHSPPTGYHDVSRAVGVGQPGRRFTLTFTLTMEESYALPYVDWLCALCALWDWC